MKDTRMILLVGFCSLENLEPALISYLERGQLIGTCIHAELWPARRYGHLNLGIAKLHSLKLQHLRILQE